MIKIVIIESTIIFELDENLRIQKDYIFQIDKEITKVIVLLNQFKLLSKRFKGQYQIGKLRINWNKHHFLIMHLPKANNKIVEKVLHNMTFIILFGDGKMGYATKYMDAIDIILDAVYAETIK